MLELVLIFVLAIVLQTIVSQLKYTDLPFTRKGRAHRALAIEGIHEAVLTLERGNLGMAAIDVKFTFLGVDEHGRPQTGVVYVRQHGAEVVINGAAAQRLRDQLAATAGPLPQLPEHADPPGVEPAEPVAPPGIELDEQLLVNREVARRLDELQGERGAFLANDLNGDGVVDADEWEQARARIRREVELDFANPEPAPTDVVTPSRALRPGVVPAPDVEEDPDYEFDIEFDFEFGVDEPNDEAW